MLSMTCPLWTIESTSRVDETRGPHGPGNDALGRQSPGSTYVPGRNPMTKLPFRSDGLL